MMLIINLTTLSSVANPSFGFAVPSGATLYRKYNYASLEQLPYIIKLHYTVKPLNSGHIGGRTLFCI